MSVKISFNAPGVSKGTAKAKAPAKAKAAPAKKNAVSGKSRSYLCSYYCFPSDQFADPLYVFVDMGDLITDFPD